VTTARHPRPQPRQARQPTPAPPGRLGTDVPQRDALPTAVHGAAPQEAGARSNPPRFLLTEPGMGYRFMP
jgi:hypothetical protein